MDDNEVFSLLTSGSDEGLVKHQLAPHKVFRMQSERSTVQIRKNVDKVSRFVCPNQRSSLANLVKGGRSQSGLQCQIWPLKLLAWAVN